MIEKMILHNFQCYKHKVLDLNYPVISFVGPTNAGKSAILRSLRWLCTNRPSGEDFINWDGASYAQVTLILDGGRKIRRRRGEGKNFYSLDGKVFSALGQAGVPDEIANLLNLGEETFQGQLDGPWWFALSPGQVSKELNRIVALDRIDSSLSYLASELRKAKVEVEVSEERLARAEEDKQSLSWIEAAHAKLAKIEELDNLEEGVQQEADSLAKILEADREAAQQEIACSRAISTLQDAISSCKVALEAEQEAEAITELLDTIEETEAQLCQNRKDQLELKARIRKLLKGRCPLCRGPMPTQ